MAQVPKRDKNEENEHVTSQRRLAGTPRASGDGTGSDADHRDADDEEGYVEVDEDATGFLSRRLLESGKRRRHKRIASWVTAMRITFSAR